MVDIIGLALFLIGVVLVFAWAILLTRFGSVFFASVLGAIGMVMAVVGAVMLGDSLGL